MSLLMLGCSSKHRKVGNVSLGCCNLQLVMLLAPWGPSVLPRASPRWVTAGVFSVGKLPVSICCAQGCAGG